MGFGQLSARKPEDLRKSITFLLYGNLSAATSYLGQASSEYLGQLLGSIDLRQRCKVCMQQSFTGYHRLFKIKRNLVAPNILLKKNCVIKVLGPHLVTGVRSHIW